MGWIDPDAELVARAIVGESAAQAELVDRSLGPVLDWCRRLGGPSVDAEDCAHDVLVQLITRLDTLRDPDAFVPWLYQTTRRMVTRHRRRAWVRRVVPMTLPDRPDPDHGPNLTVLRSETSQQVLSILEHLPAAQREALVLCDVEGRSATEASKLLGVPSGTVKSRLRLGRRRFLLIADEEGLTAELHDAVDLAEAGR